MRAEIFRALEIFRTVQGAGCRAVGDVWAGFRALEIFRTVQGAGCRAVGDVWAGFRALLDLRCRAGGRALDLWGGSLARALDLVQLGACLRAA